jgi:CheY-like chemotaxis protein
MGLLPEDTLWFDMLQDRNLTTHTYSEAEAIAIYQKLSRYLAMMKAIVVPEMNCGQLVREVERAAKETPVTFLGKLGEDPHTPAEVLQAIRGLIDGRRSC